MKEIKKIEKLLNRVMCVDRPHLIRGLRGLKKKGAGNAGKRDAGEKEKQAARLYNRALRSAALRTARAKSIPRIVDFPDLPITHKKDEIIHALKHHRVVIIAGETGSGKTTQIPKFCMEAGRGAAGRIGCTQPRRIAAITVAKRLAEELREELGRSVGYKIRFDDRSSQKSIIKVMTDGILLAETQKDPFLNEYDTLIVDEAHERSLNIDFTLGILRDLVQKRRDLKLVITSATIDTEKFSKAFDGAPVIEVSGRMYPVELRYMPVQNHDDPDQDDQGYVEAAVDAVDMIHRESRQGDILMFMPTEQDITEAIELLRGRQYPGVTVLPLYARLSAHEQAKVFSRGPGRKIIVSTNVAETSLTIPGIKYVVDSGLARIPHYSPRTRTTALPVSPISRSSADQRKGRCGRVSNGVCIRLYDEADYGARALFTSPEILRSNLAEVILRMISLGLGDVASFPFIDAPASKSIKDGFDTLMELGAICTTQKRGKKSYTLTRKGRVMAGIPVDPKLSRILIEAEERGCLEEASVIASALSIADLRQRPQDKTQQADQKHALFKDPASDFITLLNIWKACHGAEKRLKSRNGLRKFCKEHYLSFKRLREWKDIHGQIMSVLREHGITGKNKISLTTGTKGLKAKEFDIGGPLYIELHKSLLCGYLANIAHKKEKHIFQAAKGQKAMIFPGSGIFNKAGNWIVAAEFVETSQLFARTAANIDPDWLEELAGPLCTRTHASPHWEKKRGEVVATEQVSLFGLVIVPERRVSYGAINPEEAGDIFIRSALVEGEVPRRFPFMDHNQELMDGLSKLEEKIRKRDILASDDEIFFFYKERLEMPFYNLKTFARYLKKRREDTFLRMTLGDLQKNQPDEDHLASLPDSLEMGMTRFDLEYGFDPGAEHDGVTLKVPAMSAGSVKNASLEYLVPGLFKEKITALIKNLPKKYRVLLMPVSTKAQIIVKEMSHRDRPLFSELSQFINRRFGVNVPASAWSDKGLEDHLKMRISIRDEKDREIAASRDKGVLKNFSDTMFPREDAFEKVCAAYEKENIVSWTLGDLPVSVPVEAAEGYTYGVYPALTREGDRVDLRLFKKQGAARASHREGVKKLYELVYESDINALKKDLKRTRKLKKYAVLVGGELSFDRALFNCVMRHLFLKEIRTRHDFESHAGDTIPQLYDIGQKLVSGVEQLCEAHDKTMETLKQIQLKNISRPQISQWVGRLESAVTALIPNGFLEIYTLERIPHLRRYVMAIGIRAQRGMVDFNRDQQKAAAVEKYTTRLNEMLNSLSVDSSREKADAIEEFFWMIEEYKVSQFAQELKTPVKISPKRLEERCRAISLMV
ncbi:ATP-dependent helicase HrpA [Desulfocicer vacuolatum DSM 3385]|uniref:RNA helicase n=1 Tax=Desulfocicer vacuolatum DSM 3385 TaxID=1121400 RepID=A0A1W2CQF0_9BACT|nr:ATP-dependent RNA helicase HrpA [Desulfocicer vacuolatum]SMC87487.1 ATP-dependent helicase HrpA [Desulfocicer vacuolatum DSM 3385]